MTKERNNEKVITLTDGNGKNPRDLNRADYEALKRSGMLWEFHPDAPHQWPFDQEPLFPPTPPTPAGAGTETPRTDAYVAFLERASGAKAHYINPDFARQIEREVILLRRQAEADRALITNLTERLKKHGC